MTKNYCFSSSVKTLSAGAMAMTNILRIVDGDDEVRSNWNFCRRKLYKKLSRVQSNKI